MGNRRRGHATLKVRLCKGIENRGFNQIQNSYRQNASYNKWNRLVENNLGFKGVSF